MDNTTNAATSGTADAETAAWAEEILAPVRSTLLLIKADTPETFKTKADQNRALRAKIKPVGEVVMAATYDAGHPELELRLWKYIAEHYWPDDRRGIRVMEMYRNMLCQASRAQPPAADVQATAHAAVPATGSESLFTQLKAAASEGQVDGTSMADSVIASSNRSLADSVVDRAAEGSSYAEDNTDFLLKGDSPNSLFEEPSPDKLTAGASLVDPAGARTRFIPKQEEVKVNVDNDHLADKLDCSQLKPNPPSTAQPNRELKPNPHSTPQTNEAVGEKEDQSDKAKENIDREQPEKKPAKWTPTVGQSMMNLMNEIGEGITWGSALTNGKAARRGG